MALPTYYQAELLHRPKLPPRVEESVTFQSRTIECRLAEFSCLMQCYNENYIQTLQLYSQQSQYFHYKITEKGYMENQSGTEITEDFVIFMCALGQRYLGRCIGVV